MMTQDWTEPPERRPRLPANDRVLIEGLNEPAWAINWSATGLCVLAEEPLEERSRVRVQLPERYTRCDARVVWVQTFPDGVLAGLSFLEVERGVALG